MAWSQADVDALKAAIAEGVLRVTYADRTVEYRSLPDMRQTLDMLQAEVAAAAGTARPRVYLAGGDKGLGCSQ